MVKSSEAAPSSFSEFNDQATLSSKDRLKGYLGREKAAMTEEQKLAAQVVPALANRSFHIPGNDYWQDLRQYFTNNHPVLGLFCHHPLHPIGFGKRLVVLIGSLGFGLAISNIIYLYFLNQVDGFEEQFAAYEFNTTINAGNFNFTVDELAITNYQVVLWTLGGPLHSVFDLTIWFFSACACCQAGGALHCCNQYSWMGGYLVLFCVVVIAAMASFIVVLRATLSNNDEIDISQLESAGIFDDAIDLTNAGADDYRFLISWCVELGLALFAYNFLFGTILFSGILGCGKLPFLGGRPREVMLENYRIEKERKRREKRDARAEKNWVKRKPKETNDDDDDIEMNKPSSVKSRSNDTKSTASYTKASLY